MNLHRLLCERAAAKRPLRVALIGAGKFGSMFLAQARRTPGIHVVAVADLAPQRARQRLNCHLDTTDLLPARTIKTVSIGAATPEPGAMRQFVARQLATATMPGGSVIFKRP